MIIYLLTAKVKNRPVSGAIPCILFLFVNVANFNTGINFRRIILLRVVAHSAQYFRSNFKVKIRGK